MGENLNLMQALYVTISSMAMVFLILLVILSDNSFNPISSKLFNLASFPIRRGCLG